MGDKYPLRDILEYIVALVSEFAEKFKLTDSQAYRYIDFYQGIKFIEDNYGIIHTLDFNEAVEDVRQYCRRKGGLI